MTAGRDIRALIQELESTWLPEGEADVLRLTDLLLRRQGILQEIQNADTSGLDPATREDLAGRLQAVRERDARLVAVLQQRREEALKELDMAVSARNAARGYRAAETPQLPGFRKLA